MASTDEQVRLELRPLFATFSPILAELPLPAWGGPASGVLPVAVAPRERIVPDVSTVPETICAMAASTLVPGASRFTYWVRLPTVVVPVAEQFASISPG